jgi:predicted RNase H-like HicB family nuclease
LKAAMMTFGRYPNEDIHLEDVGASQIESTLEEALRWILENDTSTITQVFNGCHEAFPCSETCTPIHKVAFEAGVYWQREFVRRIFLSPKPKDDLEMTVYDCLDCKRSWKQQLREKGTWCVYCQSVNTKPIATVSAVRDYPIAWDQDVSKELKSSFESWWASTNNQNWFSNKSIALKDLRDTAYFAFRAGHGWVPPELREKPRIPEELDDLFFRSTAEKPSKMEANGNILEAYRRGKEGKIMSDTKGIAETLVYKGFEGSVNYDSEDDIFHGRILGIRAMYSYGGETRESLRKNFEECVDEYERGKKENEPIPEDNEG